MKHEEFTKLKEYYLNRPSHPLRSRETNRDRMSAFYREVRDINWKRECERKRNRHQ